MSQFFNVNVMNFEILFQMGMLISRQFIILVERCVRERTYDVNEKFMLHRIKAHPKKRNWDQCYTPEEVQFPRGTRFSFQGIHSCPGRLMRASIGIFHPTRLFKVLRILHFSAKIIFANFVFSRAILFKQIELPSFVFSKTFQQLNYKPWFKDRVNEKCSLLQRKNMRGYKGNSGDERFSSSRIGELFKLVKRKRKETSSEKKKGKFAFSLINFYVRGKSGRVTRWMQFPRYAV